VVPGGWESEWLPVCMQYRLPPNKSSVVREAVAEFPASYVLGHRDQVHRVVCDRRERGGHHALWP
jgi:hypothetical protein